MSLYLRFGVSVQTVGVDFTKRPEPTTAETDPEVVETRDDGATLEAILSVDEQVLGHRREPDVRFFLRDRPGVLLDPADVRAALAHLEAAAAASGLDRLDVVLPLANRVGVEWLLERGFHIHPFWFLYLADEPFVQYDRYVTTAPPAIL